ALKQLTRTGDAISAATIAGFVEELNVPESVKQELRSLTPGGYVGRLVPVGAAPAGRAWRLRRADTARLLRPGG
nr:hypothetical protein [Tanacetum cinerariifolium]